jgi:tetratricopeptide (TPR) repeat protein
MLGYRADTIYPKLINATAQEKMYVYNELAFYHSISSADSALFYSEASLKLAERYNNPYEKATAYRNMGNAYGLKGNYRQAIFYLQQSLKIFQDIGDPKKIAELYLDLGKINYDIEDFPRSQVYANKLIDLINKEENKKNPVVSPFENAVITGIVAYPFRAGENYKKAIMCFKQYLELSKQIDLPAPLNNVYIKSLAETYGFACEYDSALKYTYLARNYLSANINKPEQEQTGYESDIGTLLYFKGDPDGALPLLRKAFYENRKNGSFHYAANDAVYLGDILKEKQNYDSALYFYKEALSEAAKMYNQFRTNITDTIQQEVFTGYQYLFNINQAEVLQIYYRVVLEIYKRLYKLYKTTDDPGRALANHEILYAYNDSLNRIIMNL